MALSTADAKVTLTQIIGAGLSRVDPMLQELYDTGSTDVALITVLTDLRTKYTLDQMRINRAKITAIDEDPATQVILGQLNTACANLTALQKENNASAAWVNKTTAALDKALAIYNGLTKVVS